MPNGARPSPAWIEPLQDNTPHFWQGRALSSLNEQEWESLCDGCGRCCLIQLEDDETNELYQTRVACRFLSLSDCRCTAYHERATAQPDCVPLTAKKISELNWMPASCSYRLLAENKPLPDWHPLLRGNRDAVPSVCTFAISEREINDTDELQAFIIDGYEP